MIKSEQASAVENNKVTADLLRSYHFCREISQNSNFYKGIMLTQKSKRGAIFSIYAWLRAIDDITDNATLSIEEKSKKLSEFEATTFKVLNDESGNTACSQLPENYWLAFRTTILQYHIPYEYLENMVAAQQQDLIKYHYETFEELYDYCRKVASMVGLMCIKIWGYEGGDKTLQLTEWCGIAFQLTNILRDITEDAQNHRVYLPAEFFNLKVLTADMITRIPKEQLLSGINKVIAKTQSYYQDSLELYKYIDEGGKLSFLAMFYAYRAIFEKIRANPEKILSGTKVKLNGMDKTILMISAMINHTILHRG